MDFSSQLANLQRSASAAASGRTPGRGNSNSNSNNRRGGGGRGGNNGNYNNNYRRGQYHSNSNSNYRRGRYGNHGNYGNYENGHAGSEAEEEYYLEKLVKAIPEFKPLAVPKKQKRRHIALLFLTIDDLPFENIWRGWLHFHSSHSNSANGTNHQPLVSIICHAKYPERVKSEWLRQRLLVVPPPKHSRTSHHSQSHSQSHSHSQSQYKHYLKYHSRRPEWGSIEITRAMIDLLEEAFRIGTSRDSSSKIKDSRYSTARYLSTSHSPSPSSPHSPCSSSANTTAITVDRFIFLSETCMPVATLLEAQLALFGSNNNHNNHNNNTSDAHTHTQPTLTKEQQPNNHNAYPDADKSWINARNTPNNGYARQLQWDRMSPAIPKHKIWKADQWIVLTRHHAWPLISLIDDAASSIHNHSNSNNHSNNQSSASSTLSASSSTTKVALWQCFRHTKASDELYFTTAMALLGILSSSHTHTPPHTHTNTPANAEPLSSSSSLSSSSKDVAIRRVTYCDWTMNAKNPATFTISRHDQFKDFSQVLRLARNDGCLFARKFSCTNANNNHNNNSNSTNASPSLNSVTTLDSNTAETRTSPSTCTTTNTSSNTIHANTQDKQATSDSATDTTTDTTTDKTPQTHSPRECITFDEWMDLVSNAGPNKWFPPL